MSSQSWAWVIPAFADLAGAIAVAVAASVVLITASPFLCAGGPQAGTMHLDDGRALPFSSSEQFKRMTKEHAGHIRGLVQVMDSSTPALTGAVLAVPFSGIALYVLIVSRRHLASWFRPRWTWIFIAIGCGIVAQALAFGYGWIAERIGFEMSGLDVYAKAFATRGLRFIAVSLVPVIEELYFRGRLFGLVESASGTRIAIGVTSAVFALAHTFAGLAVFPAYLAISILLGWLRARSGGLFAPMAAHSAINASAVAMLMFGAGR